VNHATRQRIRVLRLRIRLERVAADAFDRVCDPVLKGQQDRVRSRLLFLLSDVAPDELPSGYRTIRLARHVYRKTSEVMHGRYGALDLSDALVTEWEEVVDRVESLSVLRRPAPVQLEPEGKGIPVDVDVDVTPDPALTGGSGHGAR
jgi:hypothetical protein